MYGRLSFRSSLRVSSLVVFIPVVLTLVAENVLPSRSLL